MEQEEIARQIVDSAVKIHRTIGPGLLESVYQACMTYELHKRGLHVLTEVPQPLHYEKLHVEAGYRIDMLVEDCVIIENKTVDQLLPIHFSQLLTYLRLWGCTLGFLINWKVTLMKDGIRRVVNNHPSQAFHYSPTEL
jgi:GxxExxY protein